MFTTGAANSLKTAAIPLFNLTIDLLFSSAVNPIWPTATNLILLFALIPMSQARFPDTMDHLSFLVYEFVTEDDLKTFYQEWKTGR